MWIFTYQIKIYKEWEIYYLRKWLYIISYANESLSDLIRILTPEFKKEPQ